MYCVNASLYAKRVRFFPKDQTGEESGIAGQTEPVEGQTTPDGESGIFDLTASVLREVQTAAGEGCGIRGQTASGPVDDNPAADQESGQSPGKLVTTPISVICITLNAEGRLRECLESVSWADEILVIDGGSTDNTVQIARSCGARVVERDWDGFVKQRRYALAEAAHDWIFSIDADEVMTPSLAETIRARVGQPEFQAFRVNRLNHFLGKPVRFCGWSPDWVLRCFQKNAAALPEVSIHEGFDVAGKIGILEGDLLHFSYDSLDTYFEKMNRYTSLEAHDKLTRLKDKRVGILDLIFRPLSRFWRMFLARQGFRDGLTGLLVCSVSSIYLLALYAKVWEQQKKGH